MPPQDDRPERPPADRFPPGLDYPELRGLPIPVQVVVGTALLPLELAVTSVKLLKNTEALIGELVLHLRALRPAVASASQAYADGHFERMLRTYDQLQQDSRTIAFVWAPLNAVRDAIVPGPPKREITVAPVEDPPEPVEDRPPTMAEWLGGPVRRLLRGS